MRALLALLRAVALLAHVLAGLAIAILAFPALSQPRRNGVIAAWSRGLLRICGARLRVTGQAPTTLLAATGIDAGTAGRMVVANHISWIDVFAIDAALPCRFVAKAEIGRWPLLGWLVSLAGTLYIERGRRHAVAAINRTLAAHLRHGESIAIFPEGTTSDGTTLLPFHANLLAPVLEAGAAVWPVALRYTQAGSFSTATAFIGDMTLPVSLWNTLTARDLEIEVAFLPPMQPATGETRHALAERAHGVIAAHLSAFSR